jgi:hypothetical protein
LTSNLSAKDKLSATFAFNKRGDLYAGTLNPAPYASVPGFPSTNAANFYFVNLGYTRIFSSTLLNEFHFVTHRSNFLHDSPGVKLPMPAELGAVGITPDLATGPTNIWFDTGFQIGLSEQGPTRFIQNTFSWTDGITWTRGKHNWKFGAGFSPYQQNMDYDYYTNGEFDFYSGNGSVATGNDYADFLLGAPGVYYQGPLAASNIRSKSTYTFAYTWGHNLDNASGFAQRNSTVPAYSPDLFYPIFTWRTGFPFDIFAQLPNPYDPANPGSSGAGDPYLSHAAVVAPIRMLNPRHQTTINEITYTTDPTGTICEPTTTPVTGNFILDPNSFSNVPLENSNYYDGGTPNPCFPQLDPVNNPGDRTYGLPRNSLRGPDLINLDVALAKTTSITERVKLELRVEYFNALNHPEFAQPTLTDNAANIESPTFGQITTTGTFRGPAPRIGQVAARFTF